MTGRILCLVVFVAALSPAVSYGQCPDGTQGAQCKPKVPPSRPKDPTTLGRGSLRIISASPASGSIIDPDSLVRGRIVTLVVEHSVERIPPGVTPYVVLMAMVRLPENARDDGSWRVIGERQATRETTQRALEGTLRSEHVLDGHIQVRAAVWFKDSTHAPFSPEQTMKIIEYIVRRPNP